MCGRRRGGTRPVRWCGTCSWPTTSGTRAGVSRTRVLYSFGREDELDRAGDRAGWWTRCRGCWTRPTRRAAGRRRPELSFIESRPLGGATLLDGLWRRLGIDTVMRRQLAGRRLDPRVERVLFALVANRALAAVQQAGRRRVGRPRRAHRRPGARQSTTACYRAMDWLIEVEPALASGSTTRSPTCSTSKWTCCSSTPPAPTSRPTRPTNRRRATQHGEVVPDDDAAAAVKRGRVPHARQEQGLPRRPAPGRGRHGRHPHRHPGARVVLAGQHRRLRPDPAGQDDMREWNLARGSSGSPTAASPPPRTAASCKQGGGHYILGEKLRAGTRRGRRRPWPGRAATPPSRDNLQVKEVNIGADDRFVICFNPDAADRDAAVRDPAARPADRGDRRHRQARAPPNAPSCAGVISTKPGLNRFLRDHPRRPAAHRRREDQGRGNAWTASTCCAAPTRSCPPRTSPWATSSSSKSNAAGAT